MVAASSAFIVDVQHIINNVLIQIVPRSVCKGITPANNTIEVFQSSQTCNIIKQTFSNAYAKHRQVAAALFGRGFFHHYPASCSFRQATPT